MADFHSGTLCLTSARVNPSFNEDVCSQKILKIHIHKSVLTNLSENYRLKVIDFRQGGGAWRCPEKKRKKIKILKK